MGNRKALLLFLLLLILALGGLWVLFGRNGSPPAEVEAAGGEIAVRAYYFYSPRCLQCLTAKKYIATLQQKYPLQVKLFNIEIRKNYQAFLSLEKKYGVTQGGIPKLFIGGSVLIGEKSIRKRLERHVRLLLARGGSPWPDTPREKGKGLIEERFESFTFLAVLTAGLIDGVNPCAFATIVFFVSFLTFIGRKKREILLVGSCFTLAVFFTYLLIGLGVFRALHYLEIFFLLSKNIFYLVGIIAFSLGALNLYDYYRFRTGKISKMTLQLPTPAKKMIHAVIRLNQASSGFFLLATAIATGFLVSVLESICTGQVYLPTIVFILKTQGMQARAFGFLLLYNLMFVFPLIIIFGLTFFGVTSEWLGNLMKKNLGAFKILTALFFFGLGILLFAI